LDKFSPKTNTYEHYTQTMYNFEFRVFESLVRS
jgi:hypothetical protein